jgi:hypothetical protein
MLPLRRTHREISPAVNATIEEYMETLPPSIRSMIHKIRNEKAAGTRCLPSTLLVDASLLLTPSHRAALLDSVATLVDQNLCGRSDMCQQSADLLQRALAYLKFPARAAVGTATYYSQDGANLFSWLHAWVRIGDEVIDGNTDSLFENPTVPKAVASPLLGKYSENSRPVVAPRSCGVPSARYRCLGHMVA